MDRKAQVNLWYVIIAMSVFLFLQGLYLQSKQFTPIPYSQFEQLLNEDKIDRLWIAQSTIEGELKEKQKDGLQKFVTTRVAPDFAAELDKRHVTYSGTAQNTWLSDILSWVLPTLMFFGLWMFVIRRFANKQGMMGGLLSIGKSRAKVYVEKDTKVTFADVAGVDEAKDELKEVVEFLRTPKQYGRLGARMPKGVLLIGPPGTGKTLLARAVAGEAGVKFFSISGSEFVEMFVGVGAARVRDLFEEARKEAPAIIFIDELDALGRARGAFPMGGNDEKEQTLNQLLVELDGFDPTIGLILLAATNRPEILDPALLRAGRFDRQVLVDRPDKRGRIEILKVHFKQAVLASDVDPEQIAALTTGFTGADLANLINEAALLATRRGADHVHLQDFTAAIERIVAGLEKRNRILNRFEHRVVAYHELGHAIVAMALPGQDPVHKVSIIPRGIGALGYTIQRPTEDRFLMTQDELENRMVVLLGGRAAEAVVFHHLSTGAADDLAKATDIARSMVMRYGMDKRLAHVTYAREKQTMLGMPTMPGAQDEAYSEETERSIDHTLHDLMQRAFDRATSILTLNRDVLEKTAQVLLAKETLEKSPELADDQPMSQQMENQLYTYYGWDPLWGGPCLSETPGAIAWPYMVPPYFGVGLDTGKAHGKRASLHGSDPHVRSVNEVTGYHIHAADGEIGHIENFMIDDADWSIHYFIVDTRNWWPGKRVLISPLAVKSIEWIDRHVELDVSRDQIRSSPPWDPLAAFTQIYAKRLHKHYGWPGSGA